MMRGRALQIVDRLEQRHDGERELAGRAASR